MTANHILILIGVLVFVQSFQVQHNPACRSMLGSDTSGHPEKYWILAQGCTRNQASDGSTIWSQSTYNNALSLTNVICTANAAAGTQLEQDVTFSSSFNGYDCSLAANRRSRSFTQGKVIFKKGRRDWYVLTAYPLR